MDLVEVGLSKSTSEGTGLEKEILRVAGGNSYRDIILTKKCPDLAWRRKQFRGSQSIAELPRLFTHLHNSTLTENKNPQYQAGAPRLLDRLQTAIDRRLPLTSTSFPMSLDERLPCSTRKLTHVWTVHVPAISDLTLVAKIFDPQIYRPFLFPRHIRELAAYHRLQDTNATRFHGHFPMPISSQGNRTMHVLLMEHIDGKDFCILIPVQKAKDVCPAHKLAIINMALNLNLDAFVRGVYPLDFLLRNVILWNPGRASSFARRTTSRCAGGLGRRPWGVGRSGECRAGGSDEETEETGIPSKGC
ncbi:hypothetical protein ARMGADRAFT_1066537 [Armillaria gallica]|uniref:Protein kinase domain-containing protein n=1 Tax=Armillaria gallica TaxID=47427 RepID=A0A2H3CUF2_ARMGA|nr:hypothetical protein ARMGADRAFT_1066537 [Armillaria gallica]